MKNLIIFVLFFCVFIGCKKNVQQTKENLKKPELNIATNYPKPDALNLYSEKNLSYWKEYETLASFFKIYDKISLNEALNNAIELKGLVKKLKDSIKPKILDNNAFKTRVNVLENEVLRLVDMSYIPAIKSEEINTQVLKVIEVFSSLNQKINTLYSQKRFEDAINVDLMTIDKPSVKNKIVKKSRINTTRSNTLNKGKFDDQKSKKKKMKKLPLKK